MFLIREVKCKIDIPLTVVFNNAKPKFWIFNNKKNNEILSKSSYNLNDIEIVKSFINIDEK
jgi:hypothetical protein